jgi:glutamate decarboxylase
MPNYSLNFSRPSSSVILQYFAFLRLGHSGYEQIVRTVLANSRALGAKLAAIHGLELLNDGSAFPIVAVRASDPQQTDLRIVSRVLREPAGSCPPTRCRPTPSTSRFCGWS